MSEATQNATNNTFKRSAAERAFARAMGDDMSKSTAGFATPVTFDQNTRTDKGEEIWESAY